MTGPIALLRRWYVGDVPAPDDAHIRNRYVIPSLYHRFRRDHARCEEVWDKHHEALRHIAITNGPPAASWLAQLDEYGAACEPLTVEERKAWDGEVDS